MSFAEHLVLQQLLRSVGRAGNSLMEPSHKFDLFVVGGGSGGIASARRAAAYGAKVGIAEGKRWGGTCVNVGCVPKKIMWACSGVRETLHECKHYGFELPGEVKFSFGELKRRRDANIKRLNGIYVRNLESSGVTRFEEFANFVDGKPNLLKVGDQYVEAKQVLVAVGGKPSKIGVPGEEHTITSDEFFELETLPTKVAVVGAGYIAVELAGVFNGLGVETHLFVRQEYALRKFDTMLGQALKDEMIKAGVKFHTKTVPQGFVKANDGKITFKFSDTSEEGFDQVLVAVGRTPNLESVNLAGIGVKLSSRGYVVVDEFERTNVPNVHALGDINGKAELTPMAIAAGRRLADRLFGGMTDAKADYDMIPTVIFSHPPIGTVGLSEDEAKAKYGEGDIKIYSNVAVNLYYNVFDIPPEEKPRTRMKMLCVKSLDEKIVGLHLIGMASDEMMQGFGVAIKMGATKASFDSCLAIHPTAGEEAVTMAPWGLKEHPQKMM